MAQRHWNDLYHQLLALYHLDCTTHHYITCISFPLHSMASKKELWDLQLYWMMTCRSAKNIILSRFLHFRL